MILKVDAQQSITLPSPFRASGDALLIPLSHGRWMIVPRHLATTVEIEAALEEEMVRDADAFRRHALKDDEL